MKEFEDLGDLVSWKEARADGTIRYGEEKVMGEIVEKYCKKLEKENERLNNIIIIMEKYFELIIDLGFDYDGLNKEDSLKKLIDELCRYASLGRAYNTTEPIYVNANKKYNILNEELKDSDKE